MPPAPRTLVIDARPRGPRGPLAGERVLGRAVLAHLVDLARDCSGQGAIAIHARIDEHKTLRRLVEDAPEVAFRTGPPPENAAILRTDRLYDPRRLRRVLRSGRDPEKAVVWRLDRPESIDSAADELLRRRTYQPLGRYWAWLPARELARRLAPTRIRPNAVTLAAAGLMFAASSVVATGWSGWVWRGLAALGLALALILDTADGHLARLQGTASAFGKWLDAVLDELADMALHAAIAWGLFARTGRPLWLALGMLYAIGKYVFVIACQDAGATAPPTGGPVAEARPSLAARLVRLAGHADVRWHLWILLAALGRLELALIAYAAYFPIRTAALAARKAVRHG